MGNMDGKTVIVTGANSGMGLATTIELAKLGAKVIMACRSEERGRQALEQARAASGSTAIELMLCDLGSLASIRSFAEAYKEQYDRLDVLVNNAGVISLKRKTTKDGFESMIGVNHLGHFLLTHDLLEMLKAAPQGRIVNVSSGAHKAGHIHFNDPFLTKGYNVAKGYAQSKLANILFTKELAKRLAGTKVTVNSVHPGAVGTNIGVDRNTGFGKSVLRMLKPFFRSPLKGADTAIYLASSEEGGASTGLYFIDRKPAQVSKRAADSELASKFWTWSEQQVRL
ncbi:SDR family oxidoreductase [Paenibacillus harenae]|uniref:NAD(P)-dependent dehydrogenase (Short-subunit alcohol dehydrogenase family) n=1 Tax=Paenibacillus harenae TaxID=306543 RepID=A0ABT9U7Y1_PAEHA|nr:SDR family oxidoreductase [Paenibacillus harenae]MDQ0115347.1 NAD(P)-dependent dehydrogenase (short-subunit alcohol dehydrogenase family) [Paenibacillus harenae]